MGCMWHVSAGWTTRHGLHVSSLLPIISCALLCASCVSFAASVLMVDAAKIYTSFSLHCCYNLIIIVTEYLPLINTLCLVIPIGLKVPAIVINVSLNAYLAA